jgi:CRP-like cAMP-binding protein
LGSALPELTPSLAAVSYRAGDLVNEAGEKVRRVLFPTSGLISVRAVLESGHELECALVGRTNALGGMSAMGFDVSLTRDVCLTDAHGWAADMRTIRELMASNRVFEAQLRRFSFAQTGYAVQIGVCNAMHPAERRLARWLVSAADLLDRPQINMAQEELAKVLGVQRTILNPLLRRLKAQGLIEVGRGRIEVLDVDGLASRACECRAALHQALRVEASYAEQGPRGAPFGI